MNKFTLPARHHASQAGVWGTRWPRSLLIGSVASAALCLPGAEAQAGCTILPANVLTCTAPGPIPPISTGGAIDTLFVNSLDGNITGVGVDAINFTNTTSISMVNDTGSFSLVASGAGQGIEISSSTGTVTANHTGNITAPAGGIVASAFSTLSLTYSGVLNSSGGIGINASTSGAGGNIGITSGGTITGQAGAIQAVTTDGNITINNTAVLSSTGGHGISATANGAGTDIVISSSANITASGAAFSGIRAQATGTGDIGITVSGGTVSGGSSGAAVTFVGGDANALGNAGTIGSTTNNMAIRGGTGNETISNNAGGIIIGNIDLDAGTNTINNAATAQIRSGATIDLQGGTLANSGLLRPGGVGTIRATSIVGNLTQAPSGQLGIDLNTASPGSSDSVSVSVDATLQGSVAPNLVDRSLAVKQFLILSAANTLDTTGLSVADTAAYNYTLSTVGNNLFLSIQLIAISPLIASPITPNQRATVNYLDAILDNAPSAQMVLFLDTIGGLATEAEIVAALDRLNPTTYAGVVGAAIQSSQLFVNSLMSCPTANEPGNLYREGQCYWAQLKGRTTHYDTTSDNVGGREDATGVTGGVQGYMAPNWMLGAAIAYEHANADTNNMASTEGDSISGGLVAKGLYGSMTVAGSVFGGVGWFDTDRFVTPLVQAHGDHDIGFAGAGLRISNVVDYGSWYAKPILDLGATYLSYGDIQETGAGVANLIVDGESEWVANAGAALELGSRMMIQPGLMARPYLRIGVVALSESEFSLTSRFAGAPAGAGTFTVTTGYDDVLADLGAGLDIFANASGLSVNLNYDGKLGENTSSHSASAKLRVAF